MVQMAAMLKKSLLYMEVILNTMQHIASKKNMQEELLTNGHS